MLRRTILIISCFCVPCIAMGQDDKDKSEEVFTGKVKKIIDGDSIIVADKDNKEQEVQLEGIDAPEAKQAYGKDSTKALSKLISGKEVTVKWKSKDNYDRILGHVYLDDKFINLEMIRLGAAWHFKRYNKDEEMAKAEEKAREVKLGLWGESSPVAPWDFRKSDKSKDDKTKE